MFFSNPDANLATVVDELPFVNLIVDCRSLTLLVCRESIL